MFSGQRYVGYCSFIASVVFLKVQRFRVRGTSQLLPLTRYRVGCPNCLHVLFYLVLS